MSASAMRALLALLALLTLAAALEGPRCYSRNNCTCRHRGSNKEFSCKVNDSPLSLLALGGVALLAFGGVALLAAAVAGAVLWRRGEPHLKQFLFQHQLCLDWVLGADDTVADPTKTHDAFVSYAHQDHAKAANVVRGLEQRGYSTVEHCRDWMPGAAVAEHIARSVLCARRTLLLVSDDYGASKWALEEFRAAHSHALERRSARVLLVRCGLRAPERLPDDLQLHLRLNTYLDYDDTAFWDKLCRVMPPQSTAHPPKAEEELTPSEPHPAPAPRPATLAGAPLHPLTPPQPRTAQADANAKLRRLLTPPGRRAAPAPAPAPAPASVHKQTFAAQMALEPHALSAAPGAC